MPIEQDKEYPPSKFFCFQCGGIMHEDGLLHVCNQCGSAYLPSQVEGEGKSLTLIDYE